MPGRTRLNRGYLFGSLLLLAASLHAPTAYAAPGDPPRGSPAGAVYQLPLEQGRSDAAPKAGGGGSSQAGAAGETTSLYRTENNFGSSSRVPGSAAGAAVAGGSGAAAGVDTGSDDAGEGAGAGGAGGGSGDAGGPPAPIDAEVADSGNTSVAAGVGLLGAIGLLALAVGALSRRFAQR